MPSCLEDLEVLALDCQATGARPGRGHLLEIGWARTRASNRKDTLSTVIEARLLALPKGKGIPRRVQRITGIRREELTRASDPADVWAELLASAQAIAKVNQTGGCPTVIHFSRFEEPYLRHLHLLYAETEDATFPFRILCTHEITKRLFPELPRRGLRAIAGYFGHSVPELRRSAHHVAATAAVWRSTVELLEKTAGVRTWEELLLWLQATHAPVRAAGSDRIYPMDSKLRLGLPDRPGVYRFLRSNGDVLYVGKGSSLKRRVRSYFQRRSRHQEHTLEMLTQARSLDVTVTRSTLEAALLESDEIKRLSPPYNIALRERERRIAFWSRDLRHFAREPDPLHSVGPVPSLDSLRPLVTIADLLERPRSEALDLETCSSTLGTLSEYTPEVDVFEGGFELFRRKHELLAFPPGESVGASGRPSDVTSRRATISRALIALGARLWHADAQEIEEETESRVWTPQRVTDRLEDMIRRSAFFIRRACWLCLLSESTLVWKSPIGTDGVRNLVVFERGAVSHRDVLAEGECTPTPPGYQKRFSERGAAFDLPVYDRLSVLTKEIRRLVSEGRPVELRLNPSSALNREKLERMLRWV